MPNSFNKIWIHAIWSTKDREHLIFNKIERRIHDFMRNQFEEFGCPVLGINGMPDHVHCLFLLNPQKSVSEVIKQVKGATSYHINQNSLSEFSFAWQNGYAAFSVSESGKDKVYEYIKNQKTHHKTKSFVDEYDGFMKLFKFKI